MITRRGLEAINFLSGSTLAKELVNVFQKVIDYRDSLDLTKFDPKVIRTKRVKAVYNYVTEKMAPELISIIAKETNLEVTKLHLTGTNNLTGMFAVTLDFDNFESAMITIGRQVGSRQSQDFTAKDLSESVKQMVEMTKNLDLSTGKLSSNLYGPDNKRKIKCELVMDAMMAFLLHDFVPIHMVNSFTAQELAAIYLHEIGHVLTVVERSDHTCYTVIRETEHLKQITKSENKKELFKAFVEVGVPYITEMTKNNEIDPKLADAYLKAVSTGTYLLEQEKGSIPGTVLELIVNFCIHLVLFGMYFFLILFIRMRVITFFTAIAEEFTYLKSGSKVSDLHQSHHNSYALEQRADEFVSRHGMGRHLSSGLIKLNEVFAIMGTTFSSSVALRKSTLFNAYSKLMVFLLKLSGWTSPFGYEYEHHTERIMRLVQNTHAVFKNELKNSSLDYYLSDYEDLTDQLKKFKSQISRKILDVVYKYFFQYTNPSVILSMFVTGRMLNDYEKHQNQIEDLINNKLYYTSAKFRQLASRK